MEDKILAVSEDGAILYKHLTSKHLEDVCEITRNSLFAHGNVSQTLGIPDDPEALAELEQLSRISAKDGVSIIAIDKNTDRVVGMALNKMLIKSQPFLENFRKIFKNSKSRQWLEFAISTDNINNLFEHCHVDCFMEIFFLATVSEYRRKGIAEKLAELSIEIAQTLYDGINVKQSVDGESLSLEPVPEAVYARFASFISQKIGRKLGFEIAVEVSNRKLEIMGKVFENPTSETSIITGEYKMLQKRSK